MSQLELYSYYRSSSAYRVRIALYLKGIPFTYRAVHLLKEGGEQKAAPFRRLNPAAQVPTIVHGGFVLSQSMAIFAYIDENWRPACLFPLDLKIRSQVIEMCEWINSGIQPIQNLAVLKELEIQFGADQQARDRWACTWIRRGLEPLEQRLATTAGTYCFGGQITAADCFVIPQIYNARRFGVKIEEFPVIASVEKNCQALPAFQRAHPDQQPDAPKPPISPAPAP